MSRTGQMSKDKKGDQGMGIDQIRETMTKIREAHYASRNAGANEEDAATYVSTYSDIHGSRLGSTGEKDLPYRPMKKGSTNKNIESAGSVEESIGAGKRRGRDSIFASSFQAELTGLVGGKPLVSLNNCGSGTGSRARDDSEVNRRLQQHQRPAAGQAAINHNQREYRQQDVVAVHYLTPSRPRPASAPRSSIRPALPLSASGQGLAKPGFSTEPRPRPSTTTTTNNNLNHYNPNTVRYFIPSSSSKSLSAESSYLRASIAGHEVYQERDRRNGTRARGSPQLNDPMREWFYPSKRRQTGLVPGQASGSATGQHHRSQGRNVNSKTSTISSPASGLNPPFHVDTHLALKRMLKAASMGKLATSPTKINANANMSVSASSSSSGGGNGNSGGSSGNKGINSGNKDVNTRWSLDGSLSRFAAHALHPYLPNPHSKREENHDLDHPQDKDKGSNHSLLRTLQDVADDTSFQAHFDRIRQQPSHPQHDFDDVHSATEESKQNSTHPLNTTTTAMSPRPVSSTGERGRPRLADTGHFHPHPSHHHSSEDKEGRVFKQRARGTNSHHMDSVLTAHEQALALEQQHQRSKDLYARIPSHDVAALEAKLLRHLPGGVIGLRHALRQVDMSRSGVVNLEEFKAVISRKLMRPGPGPAPGLGQLKGISGGSDKNDMTRMRSSSASRAMSSSSSRGVGLKSGLGVGAGVGEVILTGEELTTLFDACATDCLGSGRINPSETWRHDARYSHGKALHIADFTDRLGHSHLAPASVRQANLMHTIKKVLHATNKQSDPLRVFSQLVDPQQLMQQHPQQQNPQTTSPINDASNKNTTVQPPSSSSSSSSSSSATKTSTTKNAQNVVAQNVVVGYVSTNQLREGLLAMGADLTDGEMKELLAVMNHNNNNNNNNKKTSSSSSSAIHGFASSSSSGNDNRDGQAQVTDSPTAPSSSSSLISLAAFDHMLQQQAVRKDHEELQQRRQTLESHPRYTPTYQVSDAVHSHVEPEYLPMTTTKIGRGDTMKWGKLQGKLQAHCGSFPSAFRRAEVGVDTSSGVEYVDTMTLSSAQSTPLHRPAAAGRRSLSHLVRPSSAPAGGGGHRRSKSLTDYYRGSALGSGLGSASGPGLESASMFATATANGAVPAGTRPNLFLSYPHARDDSVLSYSRSISTPTLPTTKSLGTAGGGRGGGGSSVVPLSRLRDVLSDAGVQLGNDDAARLEDIVRRDLLNHPSPGLTASPGLGAGASPFVAGASPGADAIEPLISLDRFCAIIGVATVPHSTQTNTMELADPRTLPEDGGIFAHSLVAHIGTTHPANPTLAHNENQIVNYSSTYMSEDMIRLPTPTSADGSRRRMVSRPEDHLPHRSDPSLFWQLQHANNPRDIFPCDQKSLRGPGQTDDFVSNYSLLRHLTSSSSGGVPGVSTTPLARKGPGLGGNTPRTGSGKSPSPPRFRATSPHRITSPVEILKGRGLDLSTESFTAHPYRLRGQGSASGPGLASGSASGPGLVSEYDSYHNNNKNNSSSNNLPHRTARKQRSSSAPAASRHGSASAQGSGLGPGGYNDMGQVLFGHRESVKPLPTGPGLGPGLGSEAGGGSGGRGMLRWASRTLADFIDTTALGSSNNNNNNSSNNSNSNSNNHQAQTSTSESQQALSRPFSLRRAAGTPTGGGQTTSVGALLQPNNNNSNGSNNNSTVSVTAQSIGGGPPYVVNL